MQVSVDVSQSFNLLKDIPCMFLEGAKYCAFDRLRAATWSLVSYERHEWYITLYVSCSIEQKANSLYSDGIGRCLIGRGRMIYDCVVRLSTQSESTEQA